MKILLISVDDIGAKPGVKKKLFGQVRGFQELNVESFLLYIDSGKLLLRNQQTQVSETLAEIHGTLDVLFNVYRQALKVVYSLKPNAIYFRAAFCEPFYLNFLRKAKASGIKVLIEIPTYPYDYEYNQKKGLKKYAIYIDKFFRRFLYRYVDHIVSWSYYEEIFGTPAIRIENGIDLSTVPVRTTYSKAKDRLNLIAVANVSTWHGYDRIIKGIKKYYEHNRQLVVHFNIVGEGTALSDLKSLTRNLKLEKYVHFHGLKFGDELADLMNEADVGIEVLGMHRRGYNECTSLKAREYCASGLPFVSSLQDSDFNKDLKFVKKVPADESPVHIPDIIDFYESIKQSNYISAMQKFAEDRLTWKVKLSPLIPILKS